MAGRAEALIADIRTAIARERAGLAVDKAVIALALVADQALATAAGLAAVLPREAAARADLVGAYLATALGERLTRRSPGLAVRSAAAAAHARPAARRVAAHSCSGARYPRAAPARSVAAVSVVITAAAAPRPTRFAAGRAGKDDYCKRSSNEQTKTLHAHLVSTSFRGPPRTLATHPARRRPEPRTHEDITQRGCLTEFRGVPLQTQFEGLLLHVTPRRASGRR